MTAPRHPVAQAAVQMIGDLDDVAARQEIAVQFAISLAGGVVMQPGAGATPVQIADKAVELTDALLAALER